MRISVIGTGYVGLVTGVCFAEMGNTVFCIDHDQGKIKMLQIGKSPIYEPGLEELILKNLRVGNLRFSADIVEALDHTDICFIAVGTPSGEDGSADLNQVFQVATIIGENLSHEMLIVDKSTVPVGTADKVREIIQNELDKRRCIYKFDVVSNPEFLKEGAAIQDCMRPDRIIIGADREESIMLMKQLYSPYVRSSERFISMDIKSAEMTKYAANAMLATKISFMNEMANICEKVGANINHVRVGIGSDTRIGYHFIYPGCGYGGSCFPKDVKALIKIGNDNEYNAEILKAVETVNVKQKLKIVDIITDIFGDDLRGLIFGIWGLAFKPDTNDMREASSIIIIHELCKKGASVRVYDPEAMEEAKRLYLADIEDIVYCGNKYDAIQDCDAMILITEWKEFKSPDFVRIKDSLARPIIIDGRNQYEKFNLESLGIDYYQIGVSSRL